MKVLITGHTHGIGKAILENCPSDYEVKGMSRETGHDLINNLPNTLGQIKEYNPDIFFNNAGIANYAGAFEDIKIEEMNKIIDVNFKGVVNGCFTMLEILKNTKNI